ncbi:MAG: hypothetical protein AAFP89_18630 [Bacteroidota bacterium]
MKRNVVLLIISVYTFPVFSQPFTQTANGALSFSSSIQFLDEERLPNTQGSPLEFDNRSRWGPTYSTGVSLEKYVNEKLGLSASFAYQYKPLTVFFFPSAFNPQLPLEDIFNIGVDQKRDHFLLLDLSGRYYSDGTRSRTRFFVEGGVGLRHHFMQAILKPLHPDPMIREQVIRGFNLSLSLGIPTWVLSAHVSGGFQYAFSRKWGLEMAALGRFIHRSPFQLGIQLTIVRFIQDR